MANFRQAPRNTNKKPDCGGNFMKISIELFQKINEKIPAKSGAARSLMYLLIGTADGFRLSEKYVMDKLGIIKSTYTGARQYLESIKFITRNKETNEIIINYDVIMGNTEYTPSKGIIEDNSSKMMSNIETSSKSNIENTPKSIIQYSHNIEETNKKHINTEPQAVLSVSEAKASGRFQEDDIKGVITRRDLERIGEENIIILENGVIQSRITGMKFRLMN